MARLHVLAGDPVSRSYTIVVHAATPAGNNLAGVSWAAALVASGRAKTVMTEGNDPGQISAAEKNAILAGTVIEGVFSFTDNPAFNDQQRVAMLDQQATQVLAELQARLGVELLYWGATLS